MYKLALIGGEHVAKYTIADVLWQNLAEVSNIDFSFEIIPLADEEALASFYSRYKRNDDFIGFNVALPWKSKMAEYAGSHLEFINTVYKKNQQLLTDNTDPLGVQRGFEARGALLKNARILVLGAGGGGMATALHLASLHHDVYIYDIEAREVPKDVTWLRSLSEVASNTYDLAVNATPLGKYYFEEAAKEFASPVDIAIAKRIMHPGTVFQEMNYLPIDTLFLQIGSQLGARTIPGTHMLVYQAVESLQRHFGVVLDHSQVARVIEAMNCHVSKLESDILDHSNRD